VEEATASLATMVVVSILDDASRRHRERREKASGRERGSFRKSEEVTKLELESSASDGTPTGGSVANVKNPVWPRIVGVG
jgi:hypothetical protein